MQKLSMMTFLQQLVYIYFKVKGTDDSIVVASTRPELLFACQSIIVNPKDERYVRSHRKVCHITYI